MLNWHCEQIYLFTSSLNLHRTDFVFLVGILFFRFEPVIPCNSNCTCNMDIFEPICGPNDKNYANACYAGCPNPSFDVDSNDTLSVSTMPTNP